MSPEAWEKLEDAMRAWPKQVEPSVRDESIVVQGQRRDGTTYEIGRIPLIPGVLLVGGPCDGERVKCEPGVREITMCSCANLDPAVDGQGIIPGMQLASSLYRVVGGHGCAVHVPEEASDE
jgi:hypothetical protein